MQLRFQQIDDKIQLNLNHSQSRFPLSFQRKRYVRTIKETESKISSLSSLATIAAHISLVTPTTSKSPSPKRLKPTRSFRKGKIQARQKKKNKKPNVTDRERGTGIQQSPRHHNRKARDEDRRKYSGNKANLSGRIFSLDDGSHDADFAPLHLADLRRRLLLRSAAAHALVGGLHSPPRSNRRNRSSFSVRHREKEREKSRSKRRRRRRRRR